MAMTKEEVVARKIEKMFLVRDLRPGVVGFCLFRTWRPELQTMIEILEPSRLARQEQGVKQG